MDGFTEVISLLRTHSFGNHGVSSGGGVSKCVLYLPSALVRQVDLFGRTALHLARGSTVAEALLNATAPGADRSALLAAKDLTGTTCPYALETLTDETADAVTDTDAVLQADTVTSTDEKRAGSVESGGWDESLLSMHQAAKTGCDFDAIDAAELTASRFSSHYLLRSRPLLIRNAVPIAWRQSFSRPALMSSIVADAELAAGEIPYGSQFGAPLSLSLLTLSLNCLSRFLALWSRFFVRRCGVVIRQVK